MDPMTRREIILAHYQDPTHKGLEKTEGYEIVNTNNSSCIDNLDIAVQIKDGIIEDIRFDGEACAISTSATSIMIKLLLHKTEEEARKIIREYEKMLKEEPYDANLLEELVVYDEISKQPNRKNCAMLPFKALKKVLHMEEED